MSAPSQHLGPAAVAGNWFWGIFATIGLLGETYGLASGNYAFTLSETLWRAFDILPGQTFRQWTAAHVLFAVLWLGVVVVWLSGHFILGWWR